MALGLCITVFDTNACLFVGGAGDRWHDAVAEHIYNTTVNLKEHTDDAAAFFEEGNSGWLDVFTVHCGAVVCALVVLYLSAVLFLWVFSLARAAVRSTRIKYWAEVLQDGVYEGCVSVGIVPLLAQVSPAMRESSRVEDWVMDALCKVSGHLGVFVSIGYSLVDSDVADPTRGQVVSSRAVRRPVLGSQILSSLFSVHDLVSAYQWAFYSIAAPLDPNSFDMDAYLATPTHHYPLLEFGPPRARSLLDCLTIYDLVSAYCYATYLVPPLLPVCLNAEVDDGLELTDAALVFYYPELLPGSSQAGDADSAALRLCTSVLFWLELRTSGPEDVSVARIEEVEDDQDQGQHAVIRSVVYGPDADVAPGAELLASTFALVSLSTQDLLAAFAYAHYRIRPVEVRFACSIVRVVHRTKAADLNVHLFNDRTRARLLRLVEDPPEAFRCRPSGAFARVESFASATTEGSSSSSSSSSSDSDFPYTDHSDFGSTVDLDIGLELDSDGSACDADSDMDEMTWMLEELTVDDYPSLYDWELEELVRALEALTIDELRLLCLQDADLADLLALLRTATASPDERELVADVARELQAVCGTSTRVRPSSSLCTAVDALLVEAPSDTYRALWELLVGLGAHDAGDLPRTWSWTGKGKGPAVNGDGDRALPGIPRARAPPALGADSDNEEPQPKKKKRHRGGKRIPMAERRRRNRHTVQETLAPLRDVEFVEGPSWCPDDDKWAEGFGWW